jgi:hypothetical protein
MCVLFLMLHYKIIEISFDLLIVFAKLDTLVLNETSEGHICELNN